MAETARSGDTWYIVARDIVVSRAGIIVDDETDDADVSYELTHNGVVAGSGSLAWEAYGYDDAWVARIALPATPGILRIEITASASVDGDDVVGSRQTSLKIV
jgi:hypothetical protein